MHRENESWALRHNLYKKCLLKVYKPNLIDSFSAFSNHS